uniref:Putative group i salivary lipocalin n=1 Tax=Rhipicephalus pulchellus TaxID=72859 RepID=L7LSR9_RHIPC
MRRMVIQFIGIMLVCALLVANYATSAASERTREENGSPGGLNLREFFNTNMYIWTFLTTANGTNKCQVDKKEFINATDVYFTRTDRTRTATVIASLHGKFDVNQPYGMEVGPKLGKANGREELLYQAQRKSCGVFGLRHITNGTQYHAYDVRVRGYGGKVSAQKCLDWFNETYPEQTFKRQLYTSSCKSITRIRWVG